MSFGFVVTDAFKARFAAESAGGPKIVFTSFAVGDGNGVVPALPVSGLVHQVYAANVARVQVDATNNKQVNIECPIPDVGPGGTPIGLQRLSAAHPPTKCIRALLVASRQRERPGSALPSGYPVTEEFS